MVPVSYGRVVAVVGKSSVFVSVGFAGVNSGVHGAGESILFRLFPLLHLYGEGKTRENRLQVNPEKTGELSC